MHRIVRVAMLALAALAAGAPALAQDHYPNRTVRLVVGFGAGGPTDIPARHVADKLGTLLGQRLIVENKTGAAGMLATRDVLAQPADGYNLLLCTHFESINTALYKNPGFKLADLAPISLIARYYYGLAVANAVPANDFERPRAIRQGASRRDQLRDHGRGLGAGNPGAADREACRHPDEPHSVPHRDPGDAGPDRRPGVDVCVADHRRAAATRATSSSRSWRPPAPSGSRAWPTCRRSRRRASTTCATASSASARPKGTPQPILDLLNRHIVSIVATPDYRDLIEKGGSLPESSTPQQLGQVITQTVDDVEATIREFGMQQE